MFNASSNDSPRVEPIPLEVPSTIPIAVRNHALKFAHFTDEVMGRLNRIGARLSQRCLREIQHCPEHYAEICAYHTDLLARAIGQEVQALYHCLRVDTMEAIDHSCQHWLRRKDPTKPPTAAAGLLTATLQSGSTEPPALPCSLT